MTYDQLIKKYGDEEVTFTNYYKYWFTFENDNGLRIISGGDKDEIYRLEVTNKPIKVISIDIDYFYNNNVLIYKY